METLNFLAEILLSISNQIVFLFWFLFALATEIFIIFFSTPLICGSVSGLIVYWTVLRGGKVDDCPWTTLQSFMFWGGFYLFGFCISLIWLSNDNEYRTLYSWVESWGYGRWNIVIGIVVVEVIYFRLIRLWVESQAKRKPEDK